MNCEIIESNANSQFCINSGAKRFHLNCGSIYALGQYGGAINLTSGNSEDIYIEAEKIITGKVDNIHTGITAVISRGNGFIKVDEIFCRNLGHYLSHRAGKVISVVRKLTTIFNTSQGGNKGATVHQAQGLPTQPQTLILYFDEINATHGDLSTLHGVIISQGNGILIGRRIFAADEAAVEISTESVTGYLKCNEIISENSVALILQRFTTPITIDTNLIEGNNPGAFEGPVWCTRTVTFVLKNALVRNKNSNSLAVGMTLLKEENSIPNVTLRNVKIISNGTIIYYNSSPAINIDNYGLIGNKDTESYVNLQIGTSTNCWFIDSPDLT